MLIENLFYFFFFFNYYEQNKNHHSLCCCFKCKRLANILYEIDHWSFYDFNKMHKKWFIILHKKFDPKITIFPVFILRKCQNKL